MKTYKINLSFDDEIQVQDIFVTLDKVVYLFSFCLNNIEGILYLSVTSRDRTVVYFGGYRCVFGTFFNKVDNGFPYLLFFVDKTGLNFKKITFDAVNKGVTLYARTRT